MREQKLGRFASIIRKELAEFLQHEADIPEGAMLSITRVVMSSNAAHADVHVSVYPTTHAKVVAKNLKTLENKARTFIRRALALRHSVSVRFHMDVGEDARTRIEILLAGEEK